MIDQSTFIETLHEVSEIVRTAGRQMTEDEVLQYFSDMELTDDQKEMVINFMNLPEEVRDPAPEEEETADSEKETVSEEEPEQEKPEEIPEDIPLEKLSDSNFYRMYLEEVRAQNVQEGEARMDLYRRHLSGDSSAAEQIVNSWLLRIIQMARLYRESPVNMEDLIQEGNMGLWLAISDLPEMIGADEMEEYLTEKVKTAMEDYIRQVAGDSDWLQAVLGKAALLVEAREVLKEENGQDPSLRQISEYTHIPVEEVKDILALYKEQKPEEVKKEE